MGVVLGCVKKVATRKGIALLTSLELSWAVWKAASTDTAPWSVTMEDRQTQAVLEICDACTSSVFEATTRESLLSCFGTVSTNLFFEEEIKNDVERLISENYNYYDNNNDSELSCDELSKLTFDVSGQFSYLEFCLLKI